MNVETLHLGLSAEEEDVMNSSHADPLHTHMLPLRNTAAAAPKRGSSKGGRGAQQVGKKARVDAETKQDEDEQAEEQDEQDDLEVDDEQRSNDGDKPEEKVAEQTEEAADGVHVDNSYEARMNKRIMNRPKAAINGTYTSFVARPIASMKGHTAFLTFAIRNVD